MKVNSLFLRWNLTGALLLLLTGLLPAQTLTRYDATPASKVRIEGTSTVHDWTMDGQLIAGYLELDPAALASPKPGKVNARAQASIPVRAMKSGKSSMDQVMQEAMKAVEHPKIEYKLTELSLKEAPKSAADPMQFDSKGEITVSGVTKPIAMTVTIARGEDNKLKISGAAPLKMTDFGVKPPAPSLGLGFIKTGDDIKISFEWVTAQKQ